MRVMMSIHTSANIHYKSRVIVICHMHKEALQKSVHNYD